MCRIAIYMVKTRIKDFVRNTKLKKLYFRKIV